MPSEWNMFVKKIYEEGKSKDANYEFKQALVDASKRKSEMGHSTASGVKTKKRSRSKSRSRGRKASASVSMSGGKRHRRSRRRRH